MKKCKRCGLKTALTDEDIQKMIQQVRAMRGVRLATDEERNKRLAACGECDKLMYGSTCALCGCVVEVRAMLKDGKCPYPKKSKWQS